MKYCVEQFTQHWTHMRIHPCVYYPVFSLIYLPHPSLFEPMLILIQGGPSLFLFSFTSSPLSSSAHYPSFTPLRSHIPPLSSLMLAQPRSISSALFQRSPLLGPARVLLALYSPARSVSDWALLFNLLEAFKMSLGPETGTQWGWSSARLVGRTPRWPTRALKRKERSEELRGGDRRRKVDLDEGFFWGGDGGSSSQGPTTTELV